MRDSLRLLAEGRTDEEGRAIRRLLRSPVKLARFRSEVQSRYGVDPENIKKWLKFLLDHLPEILALILEIMK